MKIDIKSTPRVFAFVLLLNLLAVIAALYLKSHGIDVYAFSGTH